MKHCTSLFALLFLSLSIMSQSTVSVEHTGDGMYLKVDGEKFIVNGINWDYVPIGTDVLSAAFWDKPDDIIMAALDQEMPIWQNMGVNAIRTYIWMPPKWIKYIYENFGIYTMINSQFGAYGLTINGTWFASTNYSDPEVKKALISESVRMAELYKDVPGFLLYMLGNENNFHLSWEGAETDSGIPIDEEDGAKRQQARNMYKLFNEATVEMKKIDKNHPIAVCNGDLLYLDLVVEECVDVDIYGTNMYRGAKFGDAFDRVKSEYGRPILFTEFGADAYNARDNKEDQYSQAYYVVNNWLDIYENAYGMGKANNSLGGFTFQSSDGWWKTGFDERKEADTHQSTASWPANGYPRDQAKPGDNNMNEEWFGIAAKGPTDERGLYMLYPRAAYYALQEVHKFNPYAPNTGMDDLQRHFQNVNLMDAVLKARGDKASMGAGSKVNLSNMRAEFTTFNTGGSLITTPTSPDPASNSYPNKLGFDHMQSYFIGIEGRPNDKLRAEINFNILGRVAENPINEVFYENRGLARSVNSNNGPLDVFDQNRIAIYNADVEWKGKDAEVHGFYRTGHFHWAYEGDFFGLYPEANYGPNLDIYNGEILGVEAEGKGKFSGLKAALGPQLWWGANPAMLLKYEKNIGKYDVTGIFHEDLDGAGAAISSIAIPVPQTRRATLHIAREIGKTEFEFGGIWAGSPLNGRTFQDVEGTSGNYIIYEDKIAGKDNWGGKAKITYTGGKFNWYISGAAQGLVANGGFDPTLTFTKWKLKDTGSGNQTNILTGFTFQANKFQIAPNFLWQKPIVAAIPNDVQAPGRLRNIQDDPFAVRGNRETTAGEILVTYDPTPETWIHEWNNDRTEDAPFAFSAGFVYRHHPTAQDAAIGFNAQRASFAFPGSAPAEDLWEAHARVVSKLSTDVGVIGNFYYGNAQANGSDERLIKRFGADLRGIYKKIKVMSHVKFNDWGPFDYHRDYNLTYPAQLMLDVSANLGNPDFITDHNTKIGIRGTWRSLDQFSPRFLPNFVDEFATEPVISPVGFDNGEEWEIRTYLKINIGN